MDTKEFSLADELHFGADGVGVERLLVHTIDAHGLEASLSAFDSATQEGIERSVQAINLVLGVEPPPPTILGVTRRTWRTMRGVHHGLIKWNSAKIREAVSLAGIAGSLSEPDTLHVHDVCGGKGAVALYVEFLREIVAKITTGTCWELESDRQEGHEWIRTWIGLHSPLDFQSTDVAHANLSRRGTGKTHALAKHACGPLTDAIFTNVAALPADQRPDVTAVMTCCHSYLRGTEAFWPDTMKLEERLCIAQAADPQKELDPYKRDIAGVVARRVIDTLRALHMGAQVTEALPFGKACHRNQVIHAGLSA